MAERVSNYQVLPLPIVQKSAKKILSPAQLREGIKIARSLKFYPDVPDLEISRCGDGMELRIEHPKIGKQGWLRAIFWIDEKERTIYIVDLFWKKTNAISTADKLRANHRIRGLRLELAKGKRPWA
jgi:hypothetical protein